MIIHLTKVLIWVFLKDQLLHLSYLPFLYMISQKHYQKQKQKTYGTISNAVTILDLMRTMCPLGSLGTTVFFQFFGAQIKPLVLYTSEVWGTSRLSNIETADV